MRVVPFVRREPRQYEQHEADAEVGGADVYPDLEGEWCEEREEAWVRLLWSLEEDAYSEVHERLREVNHLLADVADGQGRDSQISFLSANSLNYHSCVLHQWV